MAEVQPLRALHYDLDVVGSLDAVAAPPYDVIDPAQRARLAARSPYNVVRVDLPEGEPDPYANAAQLLERWQQEGALDARRRAGPVGADPGLHRAGRAQRSRGAGSSRGCASRTTAPGASAPTSARIPARRRTGCASRGPRARTSRRSSASTPTRPARPGARSSRTPSAAPYGEHTDDDGTTSRLWRVADPGAIATATEALRDAELLIADGHHRYETARVYAEEVGGEGDHRYVLMCLVALEDPGLTIFPTHRLVSGLKDDPARIEALTRHAARALRDRAHRRATSCARPTGRGRCSSATSTATSASRSA